MIPITIQQRCQLLRSQSPKNLRNTPTLLLLHNQALGNDDQRTISEFPSLSVVLSECFSSEGLSSADLLPSERSADLLLRFLSLVLLLLDDFSSFSSERDFLSLSSLSEDPSKITILRSMNQKLAKHPSLRAHSHKRWLIKILEKFVQIHHAT